MSDEQIDTMLQMHRHLIVSEMTAWCHKINKDYRGAELQEQVNNEKWSEFALWLRKIRDE
jgi:hypothetical protein